MMKFKNYYHRFLSLGFAIGFIGIITIFIAEKSYAQPIKIGKVVVMRGNVQIIPKSGITPVSLNINSAVHLHDTIKTGIDAAVHIMLNDESILSLGENTEMELSEYIYDPGKEGQFIFKVKKGVFKALAGKINRLRRHIFEVHTPTAIAGARGTFFLGRIAEASLFVTLDDDPIVVSNIDRTIPGEVILDQKGMMTIVEANLPPTIPVFIPDVQLKEILKKTKTTPKKKSLPGIIKTAGIPTTKTITAAVQRAPARVRAPERTPIRQVSTIPTTPPFEQVPQNPNNPNQDIVEEKGTDTTPTTPTPPGDQIPDANVDILNFVGSVSGSGSGMSVNGTINSLTANLASATVTGSMGGTFKSKWQDIEGSGQDSGTWSSSITGTVSNLQISGSHSGTAKTTASTDPVDIGGIVSISGAFNGSIASDKNSAKGNWNAAAGDGDAVSGSWSATRQ